jgi:RNA polymerase sigma-70 factor (ECF subfamily)
MSTSNSSKRFLALLMQYQLRLTCFVRAAIPNRHDADDVTQTLAATLWEKFDHFEEGSDFEKWAIKTARFTILAYYRDKKRSRVCFSEPLVEQVMDSAETESIDIDERADALRHCLSKLPVEHREAFSLRYRDECSNRDAALRLGVDETALSKRLKKIRSMLLTCVEKQLAMPVRGVSYDV